MRARLLITFPTGRVPDGSVTPFAPPLIIEAGPLGMFTTDWVRRFDGEDVEALTEEQVRAALCLEEGVSVHLAPVRELPDADLFSETVSAWRQQWWQEAVAELRTTGAGRGVLATVGRR